MLCIKKVLTERNLVLNPQATATVLDGWQTFGPVDVTEKYHLCGRINKKNVVGL